MGLGFEWDCRVWYLPRLNIRIACEPSYSSQAQEATLGRVGMGGLGEDASHAQAEAGLAGGGLLGNEGSERRGEAGGVAHADVVHKASEAEQVLQLLLQQLRNVQKLPPASG